MGRAARHRKDAFPRARQPARPAAAGLGARRAALALLRGVLRARQSLDDLLAEAAADGPLTGLDARDRAFARLLAATSLRRLGEIDDALGRFLDRPLPPRAGATQDILRLGAAQILFLGTPAHAAVASAVELATGARDARHFRGLVNAVLRRLGEAEPESLHAPMLEAGRRNTPDWLFASWARAYGEAAAAAIANAHLLDPPLDLTLKNPAEAEIWAARLEARILPTGSLRRSLGGRIEALPGFEEGAWWVQDAAAALPARLLGAVRGRRVLDLCAAPGGKTAELAAAGAEVTAVDWSEGRLARLRANLDRLGLEAACVAADIRVWRPHSPADLVLLDAPCSSTGTIRRHPDIPYTKTPADIAALSASQDALLDAAVLMLAPGGVLVYCTCSLQPEEGPERIAALLARGAPLTRRPIAPAEIGGLAEAVTAEGDLRSLSSHWAALGGLDGFYACRLVKN
jgi:16S rRNA (cytosine967-C5)-methyltransferase